MKSLIPFSIVAFVVGISLSMYLFIGDKSFSVQNQTGIAGDGNFTLHDGEHDIQLSDYKGKAVFIFFGYTSCPDVCPTSLAFMSGALKELTQEELEKVQVLFISVDPDRDTAEKLRSYTEYFHPQIRGISGTKQEIDKVVEQYNASYKMVESDSAMGYLVDHTASFYVVDTQGKLVNLLPHGLPVKQITGVIRDLI